MRARSEMSMMLRRPAALRNLHGRPQAASARAQLPFRATELCGGPSRTLPHASHDGRHGGPGGDHCLDHADLSHVACSNRRTNDGGLSFSWKTEAAWAADDNIRSSAPRAVPPWNMQVVTPGTATIRFSDILP